MGFIIYPFLDESLQKILISRHLSTLLKFVRGKNCQNKHSQSSINLFPYRVDHLFTNYAIRQFVRSCGISYNPLRGNSRGKVRDSTLEFEGVHLTQKTIFATDSKNTFSFFYLLWFLFYVYLVKTVEVAAFQAPSTVFTK